MTLAREHDDILKEARQDLFRAQTKLKVERTWRWPIRVACVALGAVGLAAYQNDVIREETTAFIAGFFTHMRASGVETAVAVLVGSVVIIGAALIIRRLLAGPSPEEKARKLMEQFGRSDGVAAYVFSSQDNADDEAAMIGALARPNNKRIRQRRLTSANRLLSASLSRVLNRPFETDNDRRLREMIEGDAARKTESA